MSALLTSLRTSTARASTISRVPGSSSRCALAASRSSSFHTSSARSTLKETDKNRDDLGDVYEGAKEDNLRRVKEGKRKWKQELASDSEAAVKADRDEVEVSEEHIQELQKQSIKEQPK